MRSRPAVWLAIPLLTLAACGSSGAGSGPSAKINIAVNAPFTKLPYVGTFSMQGAQLAASEINAKGGVRVGGTAYAINLEKMDNGLSPSTSLDNIQKAIADKAVAVIDDGYTVDATYKTAAAAGLPVLIDYDGNTALVDAAQRPNVFRIAPPNDAVAEKLVGYVAGKGMQVALAHDDSEYGKDGDAQLAQALKGKSITAAVDLELPSSATGFADEALQVKQSNAAAVIVWARSPVLASFLKAMRQGGSTAAVYSAPTAEDPVVRTQLADHPEWVDGLTYASFRITTEAGGEAWDKFRGSYEAAKMNSGDVDYKVGVQNPKDHKDVVQPPDWQIFSYDIVYLVKAALEQSGTVATAGGKIVDALNNVQVKSANGDNRGWKKDNHEGVVDDDIIFNVFQDMKFKPVQDDPLSKSLTPIDQE